MTAPGIGPITASYFVALIKDLVYSAEGAKLAADVGLTPGENSSGQRTQKQDSRTRATAACDGY